MSTTETTKICILIDSVRKNRTTSEYRLIPRARCNEFEIVGDGIVIRDPCHVLRANNYPIDALFEICRGDTLR